MRDRPAATLPPLPQDVRLRDAQRPVEPNAIKDAILQYLASLPEAG